MAGLDTGNVTKVHILSVHLIFNNYSYYPDKAASHLMCAQNF